MTGVEEAAVAPAILGTAGAATYGGLTAAQLAALALSVGGTGASIVAQQQQAAERRGIANKQLQRTNAAQDKTNQMIAAEGDKYNAAARNEALDQQQQQTFQQETKDVGAAPTIIDGAGDAGNVSSDYLTAKADKAISEGDRLTAIARELAKTRAPGQLMTTEGLRRADLTGSLSSIWGSERNAANASRLDAENVAEPAYGALGKLASAAGGAYLGSGAGAASSAPLGSGITMGGVNANPATGYFAGARFGTPSLGGIRFGG